MNDKKGQAILTIRCIHATPEDGPKPVGDPSEPIFRRSEGVELAFRWSPCRAECILVQRVQKALTSDAIESRPFWRSERKQGKPDCHWPSRLGASSMALR